jgi:hypothetical protein
MSTRKFRLLIATVLLALQVPATAQMHNPLEPHRTPDARTVEEKIRAAMSAGPSEIATTARVVDIDHAGNQVVLREGTNDFTCMPGHGDTHPAMCADKASMQWFKDFGDHRSKPRNTVPGITYMLAGATQRSDSDPYDKTSPLIPIGPHWMIMWPFDSKTTGLPTTHRSAGAYIMWGGTPYAHVHVMGAPEGVKSAMAQVSDLPQSNPSLPASSGRPDAWKIENALSAGPKFITDHAAVMDWPSAPDQEMRVLRKGSNGWTCMPGPPGTPRYSPMCNDQTMMKWMMAMMAGKKPNVDRIGISYMLQGEAGSDVQDLNAKTPPPGKDWYYAGPHVMLALPDGDQDALKDVGQDTSSGTPYVRGPNSLSPLLVIPVAKSDEEIVLRKAAASK